MDERTKCLIVALEKLAKLGNGEHYGNSDGNMIAREALANYRIHKPTSPASLVDELREAIKNNCYVDLSVDRYVVYVEPIDKILSRHAQRTEIVLAEGPFDCVQFSVADEIFVDCPEARGKEGQLVFMEAKK